MTMIKAMGENMGVYREENLREATVRRQPSAST